MSELPDKIYVGTMNDGIFIIDKPPRPCNGNDYINPDQDVSVIATMARNDMTASTIADAMCARYTANASLVAKAELFDEMLESINVLLPKGQKFAEQWPNFQFAVDAIKRIVKKAEAIQ